METTQTAPRAIGPAALAAPGFVLLWSTGFIGAKLGLPHADPLIFLTIRFTLAGLLLALVLGWSGAFTRRFFERPSQYGWSALIGVLVHGGYLGGVFGAIALGVEAGMSALIVGLQPIAMAAIAAVFLGERLRPLQLVGFALGLCGVALVVSQKLSAGLGSAAGVALCLMALLAIAVGTVLQKRFAGDIPLRRGAMVQYFAAAAVLGVASLALEDGRVDWTAEFLVALGWLTLVLSLGAVLVYYWLLSRGAASAVASLFFLVPPATAVIAWAMFGENLGPVEIMGMLASAAGVWLVLKPPRPQPAPG